MVLVLDSCTKIFFGGEPYAKSCGGSKCSNYKTQTFPKDGIDYAENDGDNYKLNNNPRDLLLLPKNAISTLSLGVARHRLGECYHLSTHNLPLISPSSCIHSPTLSYCMWCKSCANEYVQVDVKSD